MKNKTKTEEHKQTRRSDKSKNNENDILSFSHSLLKWEFFPMAYYIQ